MALTLELYSIEGAESHKQKDKNNKQKAHTYGHITKVTKTQ